MNWIYNVMRFTRNITSINGISSINVLLKIAAVSITLTMCMQLGACLTFSDASKSIVTNNRVIVEIPDDKSSFSVVFYPPCLTYICPTIRDRPLDLDYNPAHEIASGLRQILDARGIKSGPQYYLKFAVASSKLDLYALKNHIQYTIRAELSDDTGKTIDKSVCFNLEIHRFDAIDTWRSDPETLKKELRTIASKCLATFRKELNI